MGALVSGDLFDQLLAASTLSPIFGRATIERALRRAGVDPVKMSRADLKRALPELKKSIEAFVPERIDDVMVRLRLLAG